MEQVGYTLPATEDEGLRGFGFAKAIWEALKFIQNCVKTIQLETSYGIFNKVEISQFFLVSDMTLVTMHAGLLN